MGFLKKLGKGISDVYWGYRKQDAIIEARATGLNEPELYQRNDMVKAELKARMHSVIYKLEEQGRDPGLIDRLYERYKLGVYKYNDLLHEFGITEEDLGGITKMNTEQFWDPAYHIIVNDKIEKSKMTE